MPSGNTVFLHFGILTILLSSFFTLCENKGLAAPAAPYIVVIDPGHGGSDVGASVPLKGRKRLTEKEVALKIATLTARLLKDPVYNKALGRPIKVLLTRSSDKELSLEQRAEVARSANAHLFLSIHANSDPSHHARGLETYFLNNTNLESASKLEKIENKRSKKYSANSTALLIRSIATDATVASSKQAAETIHNSLTNHLRSLEWKVRDRGVRQGLFYVLLDTQVPSVLLEAFFLSNPQDREYVSQPENREKIAEGLARGVLRFLATL